MSMTHFKLTSVVFSSPIECECELISAVSSSP